MKKKTSRTHLWKIQEGQTVKVCYCGAVKQLTYSEAKKLEES